MKKTRALALLVSAILLLGMSTLYSDALTVTTFPHTFENNIADYEYMLVGTIDLQVDYEVYFKLTVDDPIPETDLDMEVYLDGEIIFWLATGYGFIGDPEIIEEGYFWVPESGTYEIWLYGYYVPYEEGVDFTLFVDSAEDLYTMPVLEAHGLSTGALTSYVNNNPNAMGASEKAPYHDVDAAYMSTHINHECAWNTNSWTQYSLNPARFCTDDALIVGGWEWQTAVWQHDSFKDAKEFMNARNFVHYIDGVPLTDFAEVKIGPVQKVVENGEVVSYRKVMEYAVFHPGELAELIGTGQHYWLVYWIGPGFEVPYLNFYFWLMPEGWTGPGP